MLQKTRRLAAPLLVTSALCGLAWPSASAVAQAPTQHASQSSSPNVLPTYKINPGDVLEISVFGKPTLSKVTTVPPDGKIGYPYIGEIMVAGLTLGQVTQRLTAGLSKELSAPQVTVAVARQRQYEVSVLGKVQKQGKFVMRDNYRLLDLMADCGGLGVAKSEWASARLVRSSTAESIKIDIAALMSTGAPELNVKLEPGDLLLIDAVDPSSISAQILGEVGTPGMVVIPPDHSLATVITSAGKFTPRAALTDVKLMRSGKEYVLDLRQLMQTGKGTMTDAQGNSQEISRIEPNDTIIVAQNRRRYQVLGSVGRPGMVEYPENEPATVLSALSLAGGADGNANLKEVSLARPLPDGQQEIQTIDLEAMFKKKNSKNKQAVVRDIEMRPGDTLFVPAKGARRPGFSFRDAMFALPLFNLINRF